MGITLHGVVQVQDRNGWDTISTWRFNKDYELMRALGDVKEPIKPGPNWVKIRYQGDVVVMPDKDWPKASFYCETFMEFKPAELPVVSDSPRYTSMLRSILALSNSLEFNLRILFWQI